jgi:hypothetical protein
MNRSWWLCVGLVLMACPKKSNPEFFQAKADYEILVAQHGDDAYAMAEMSAVETVLKAIPERSEEFAPAAVVLDTIGKARARIAAAAAEQEVPAQPPPTTPSTGFWESQKQQAAAQAAEAAPGEPATKLTAGLPEAEFRKAFGRCVEFKGEAAVPPEGTKGTVFEALPSSECRAKLEAPSGGKVEYFFLAGKFSRWMHSVESRTREILDGGVIVREVPAAEPRAPGFVLPGMPVPEGFPAVPGAPSGLAPAP